MKKPEPRDITAVMLDLLESAEGHVPAKLINEGHAVLSRHLMRHGTPVRGRGRPAQYDDQIVAAAKPGVSDAEIARTVGCSPSAVTRWRAKQGKS